VEPLDDEYDFVRIACLDALCTLAHESAAVAAACPDFLADMLHDPASAVRVAALAALRSVLQHVPLTAALAKWLWTPLADADLGVRLASVQCVPAEGGALQSSHLSRANLFF